MYSSFFGLNVGAQGLFTARTALNVTNHNISNIETKGYSRQYHVQKATAPMQNGRRGMIGTGVAVTDVKRHRDEYLDNKYWSMAGTRGHYDVKTKMMAQMEIVLNEPNDNGISKYYANVFKALETLSKNPDDNTCRTSFVNSINSFASYINDMGEKMLDIQKDANFGITNSVNTINHHATQIGLLNHQITTIESTGSTANDLRDERDRLVDDLSNIVNTKVVKYKDENGEEHFRVSIDNQLLVEDSAVNTLTTRPRKVNNNPEDNPDLLDIYWANGKEFYIDTANLNGELKGYIDMRDGNNGYNLKGKVKADTNTTSLTMASPSRLDIKDNGELNIGGSLRYYNGVKHNADGSITFDIGYPDDMSAIDIKQAVCTDVYGERFNATITSTATGEIHITADKAGRQMEPSGSIEIDGKHYSYNEVNIGAGADMTLKLNVDFAADTTIEQGDLMDFKGTPHYIHRMNEFVRTIAQRFNDINARGRGNTGEPLFVFEGYDETNPEHNFFKLDVSGKRQLDAKGNLMINEDAYRKIDCHNFRINPKVFRNPKLVEHSTNPENPPSDMTLTLEFIKLRHDKNFFEKGEPENYIESLIGEVGIDSKDCKELFKGQSNMLHLVENRRLSVSGVSINEEVSNLMKFQQAYNMAAKIISVMDEIYDVTINRMGM